MRLRAAYLMAFTVVLAAAVAGPAFAKTSGAGHGQRHLQQAFVLRWPEHGAITTPFIPGRHEGIDIGMLGDLTIRAAHSGRVIHVGYTTGFSGYGQIVDVMVEPGVETLYAHMSAERVHVGQRVFAGENLGRAGCTGMCTGTHLHFEVRRHGVPVDPRLFLH